MAYVIKSTHEFKNTKTGNVVKNESYFKKIGMGMFAVFGRKEEAKKFDYRHQAVSKLNEIGRRKTRSIEKV